MIAAALREKLRTTTPWPANRMRTHLIQMLQRAAQQGLIQGNPAREVKKAKAKRARVEAIAPAQVQALRRL